MNKLANWYSALLRSPILWGGAGAIGFYALVHGGPLGTPLITRYFAGHPVEYMETVLFAVGLAALLIKAIDLFGQHATLGGSPLGSDATQPADDCRTLMHRLDRLTPRRQQEYYVRRLRAALEHLATRGSAEALEDHLRYLADLDASRLHASYGLFRVIVWAIPILGFLGTVVGITMALNSVDLQAPDQSMVQVLTGLGLKFDTTALSLSLAIVLMFSYFFVERAEGSLLETVDERVTREMLSRFPPLPGGPPGEAGALRRMAETILQHTDRLVQRQVELWQASLDAAAARWTQMADSAGAKLHAVLGGALTESLRAHAAQLAAAEQAAAQQGRQHWERLLQTQLQSMQHTVALQAAIAQQGEVFKQAIEAAGETARLEDALNRNLAALAGAKHFEQTVLSLAGAIHLLNARVAEAPPVAQVRLENPRRSAQAA